LFVCLFVAVILKYNSQDEVYAFLNL
jgi:hypothetical protein